MSFIQYLTRIHFADGVLEEALAAEIDALTARRVLVTTERSAVGTGLLDRVLGALPARMTVVVYDRTPPDPREADVLEAAALFAAADGSAIVALGGGAPLDLAKAVGVIASHGGSLARYAAVEGGVARIRDVLPPIIAIPTTAGTGSEVGRGTVVSLADGRRLGLVSPFLVPEAAICDPTLTLGVGALLTAATGMDALSHCVETFLATAYNPPADGIAIDGLTRAAANIERAVADGGDLDARREMMAASMNGALALQKGLGGVHALSHALGAAVDHPLPHGALNAVLLPHVLAFNAPAVGHRYDTLKRAMGLPPTADLGLAIASLAARIGLPARLSQMGVDEDAVRRAAPLAARDHTSATNPRRATAADYLRILQAAL